MSATPRQIRVGKMSGAGPDYGKSVDELKQTISFTPEEERFIERVCEKIAKNVTEEDMTPMERFKATFADRPRDRLFIETYYHPTAAGRLLDSYADAMRARDLYYYPKLIVASHLCYTARYKSDTVFMGPLSYGENLFGRDATFIDNGNPVHESPFSVVTIEDAEALDVPDPTLHGLFPIYLWCCWAVRQILNKYDLSDKIPVHGSFCEGPDGLAASHMMGYSPYMKALRKNPELAQEATRLASDWGIKLGIAVNNVGLVDYSYMCAVVGMYPVRGAEWVAEEYARIGRAVKPAANKPITHAWAFDGCIEWLPIMAETGAFTGADNFDGALITGDVKNFKAFSDWMNDKGFYACTLSNPTVLTEGPISRIQEDHKARCEAAKAMHNTKATVGLGAVDYFTTPESLEAGYQAYKEYGRF